MTVQEGGIGNGNKELGTAAVILIAAGHGEHALDMADGILDAVIRKLAFDRLSGAAEAVALGIAALDHEAVNDAVEGQAVVEALIRQLHKIFHGDGGYALVEFQLDGAVVPDGNLRMAQLLAGIGIGIRGRLASSACAQAQHQYQCEQDADESFLHVFLSFSSCNAAACRHTPGRCRCFASVAIIAYSPAENKNYTSGAVSLPARKPEKRNRRLPAAVSFF